ncbi:hypothetical protein MRX96_004201 [Rhipicephalus microplus]
MAKSLVLSIRSRRTVGTTVEPEIFAGTDAVGHESLVLDHSGFWIRPPFAMPPAVVGAPQVLQTAAAGATIEGIGVAEPECEGSQRSRTNPLSRPNPQRCQERVRVQSQENGGVARRYSQESRELHGGSTGSWQRSVGSIRSNQEGHSLNDAVGGRFHGLRALSKDDQNHRILVTQKRGLELSSVPYMVFFAALILVIFCVGAMMLMPVSTENKTELPTNELPETMTPRKTSHRGT